MTEPPTTVVKPPSVVAPAHTAVYRQDTWTDLAKIKGWFARLKKLVPGKKSLDEAQVAAAGAGPEAAAPLPNKGGLTTTAVMKDGGAAQTGPSHDAIMREVEGLKQEAHMGKLQMGAMVDETLFKEGGATGALERGDKPLVNQLSFALTRHNAAHKGFVSMTTKPPTAVEAAVAEPPAVVEPAGAVDRQQQPKEGAPAPRRTIYTDGARIKSWFARLIPGRKSRSIPDKKAGEAAEEAGTKPAAAGEAPQAAAAGAAAPQAVPKSSSISPSGSVARRNTGGVAQLAQPQPDMQPMAHAALDKGGLTATAKAAIVKDGGAAAQTGGDTASVAEALKKEAHVGKLQTDAVAERATASETASETNFKAGVAMGVLDPAHK
ncbi:hypothetical protein FOA52_008162 [Chlamydomonas sp. UWO 241]|nr:hypothetical protein FOA52_008162 [Chlamydomonas sp. UWO 241]